MFVFYILVWYPGVTMPQPKGDQVFFVVHQRQEDPTEIVAHLVKQDGLDDLKEYMVESGSVKQKIFKQFINLFIYLFIHSGFKNIKNTQQQKLEMYKNITKTLETHQNTKNKQSLQGLERFAVTPCNDYKYVKELGQF